LGNPVEVAGRGMSKAGFEKEKNVTEGNEGNEEREEGEPRKGAGGAKEG